MLHLRLCAIGGLVALTALVAPSAAPAASGQSAPAVAARGLGLVTATTVHGDCHDGGRVSLRVVREDAKTYTVTATAKGVPNGSRWRGALSETSNVTLKSKNRQFHVVARHGGWTTTATLPAVKVPFLDVTAFGSPRRPLTGALCAVLAQPAHPFDGFTYCHKSIQLVMIAIYRPDAGVVVRWAIASAKPGTTWSVTLDATSSDRSTTITSEGTASRRGFVTAREVLGHDTNPRLHLSAVAPGGQHCSLGIHRVIPGLSPTRTPAPGASHRVVARNALLTQLRTTMAAQRSTLGRAALAPR